MSKFSIDEIKKDLDDRNFDEYQCVIYADLIRLSKSLKPASNCTIIACETCSMVCQSSSKRRKMGFFIRSVNSDHNRRLTKNRIKYGLRCKKISLGNSKGLA